MAFSCSGFPVYDFTGAGASASSCSGFPVVHRRIIDAARCCDVSAGRWELRRTCRNCKSQFDSLLNHPKACRFHCSHFGGDTILFVILGETKRKFESVYTGGTMETPNSGKILQYWHCCGSEDPFHPGCAAAPHSTYDD
ncbi:hypothetical protein KSP39_PZI012816 [Platanthera zijinensis]|uniref:Uncharacterized protein n=1 Tax=Platanthera zijinensis TaxID=2320716 RepID=A0AAP0BE91_9ASPA